MLKFRVVTFFVLLSLVLGAYRVFVLSAGAQSPAKKEQKVTATIALPGVQVETLHPYGHSTTQIYPTWKHVIEPLLEWSWSKKQIVPILAESWSNPDHSTWVFKLKKGVKFHDGSDFTSVSGSWWSEIRATLIATTRRRSTKSFFATSRSRRWRSPRC